MTKDRMGEITAHEMREILPARPVVLLPLGSFEDQGPHAPMGDYLSAERMAELIAERATDARHAHAGGTGAGLWWRRLLRHRPRRDRAGPGDVSQPCCATCSPACCGTTSRG